jgi:hypothetical protein
VGNLQITNLVLRTQPGYIYELRMSSHIDWSTGLNPHYNNITHGMFVNVLQNQATNCVITLSQIPSPLVNSGAMTVTTL